MTVALWEIIHNYCRIGNLHPNLTGVTENLQESCQAVTTLKPLTAEIMNTGHLAQNPEPKTAIKHQLCFIRSNRCWRSLKQDITKTTQEWCDSGVDLISKFPSFPIQSHLPKLIQSIEVLEPQGLKGPATTTLVLDTTGTSQRSCDMFSQVRDKSGPQCSR